MRRRGFVDPFAFMRGFATAATLNTDTLIRLSLPSINKCGFFGAQRSLRGETRHASVISSEFALRPDGHRLKICDLPSKRSAPLIIDLTSWRDKAFTVRENATKNQQLMPE